MKDPKTRIGGIPRLHKEMQAHASDALNAKVVMTSDEELWLVKLGCLHIDGELGGISMTSTLSYICCNKLHLCLAVDVSNHGRFFSSGQSLCRYVVF